ncbi:hypothetical protein B5S31_g902 [[Candida] boidinii]|nr:hypothetical protein B5S31_g902 [[Candida] boidinii]
MTTEEVETPIPLSTGVSAINTQTNNTNVNTPEPVTYSIAEYFENINSFNTLSDLEKKAKYFVNEQEPKFKPQETADRFKYLLGLTDLFHHFINSKAEKDPKFREVVDILESDNTINLKSSNGAEHRRRKTEKEEDAELLNDETNGDEDSNSVIEFTESPRYINGKLRPYQIQGLNWLISLQQNHLSGILADEMGLGKTLQTISFLGYLRYLKGINGPHIVIVPKSTLENWEREFSKWTPDVNTVILTGDQTQRNEIIKNRILTCDFDVIISSYEIVIREKAVLRKLDWQYIIVDEAHRLKNEDSLLSQIIRMFHSKGRLLITGTPLQNNLHELWALLNFILPDIFSDSDAFDSWFSASSTEGTDNKDEITSDADQNKENVVQQLHKVLQPFLLRRIKSDVEKSLLPKQELNVYVGMTPMQRKWYQKILEKDIDAVNGANGKKESKTRLLNIVMQLRKCCNHPYLFEGAEPGPPYTTDEHLVYNSQKLKVLDKLLKRLKEQGSRVLIFSQMSRMLDILEDYCVFREFQYCRIDGQTEHVDRIQAIDDYNKPGSEKFVFLLTTRAGGLGINLTTADVVVLFDSDWNPQADLQAMDRAHRIGQTKQVKVFRFVTENAIEEKVIERASQKLRLDQLVIQQGRQNLMNSNENKSKGNSKDELLNMIQHGAKEVLQGLQSNGGSDGSGSNGEKTVEEEHEIDDDEIERILSNSDAKTKQLSSKYSKLGLDDLQNFTSSDSVYEWDGKNFQKKETKGILGNPALTWINPAKRERKENYSIDGYYKDVLNTGGRTASTKPKLVGPKAPKQINIYDHQFYPLQLLELYDLERSYYKKQTKQDAVLADGPIETLRQRELDQELEQLEIDNSRKLTEEEENLKQELIEQGFNNFSRRDFYNFIHLNVKYGRSNIESIASKFEDKTIEEVKEYAKVFWERFSEIEGFEKYIQQIKTGEDKMRKNKVMVECLRRKMAQYKNPLIELTLQFPPSYSSSRGIFTEEEDRFLLFQLFRIGLNTNELYELIKDSISESKYFEFDFFFQSRSSAEINRRCATLLQCLLKEFEDYIPDENGKRKKNTISAHSTTSSNGNGVSNTTNGKGKTAATTANGKKRPAAKTATAANGKKKAKR